MGESGRSLALLGGGGVFVMSCVDCVAGLVCCVLLLLLLLLLSLLLDIQIDSLAENTLILTVGIAARLDAGSY